MVFEMNIFADEKQNNVFFLDKNNVEEQTE